MWQGLAAVQAGGRLSDIGHAIETSITSRGAYGIVREYTGHGIGTEMHQEPNVPNFGRPGRGPRLQKGLALAVEPMVNQGSRHTRLLDDGWTVVTADGKRSAHFEHTVAVTDDGPWVLTALDGGAARLAGAHGRFRRAGLRARSRPPAGGPARLSGLPRGFALRPLVS